MDFLREVYFAERSLGDDSKRQLLMSISIFSDWCRDRGRSTCVHELSTDTLNLWRQENPRGWSPKTLNRRINDVVAIWRYAYRIRATDNEPDMLRIGRVRETRRIPEAWTLEELERILRSCGEFLDYMRNGVQVGQCLRHVVLVGFYTALRPQDLMEVRIDQLSEFGAPVMAKKTSSEILVRVPKSVVESIQKHYPAEVERVFAFTYSRIHFYSVWRQLLEAAGLPTGRRQGLQKLRRTAVSHAEAIQRGYGSQLAGHTDERTTRRHYDDPRISRPDGSRLPDLTEPTPPKLRIFKAE